MRSAINPKSAMALAYWLAKVHPPIFAAVLKQTQVSATQKKMSGFGALPCTCLNCRRLKSKAPCCKGCASRPLGRLGQDLISADDIISTPDLTSSFLDSSTGATDAVDASTFTLDTVDPATFAPITLDVQAPDVSIADSSADLTPTSATASGAPSPVASALSAVGSALINPQVLTGVLGLGAAYFKATAAQSNAQTAQSVLQSQIARVYGGANPAAVSYTVNPQTGQLTPVLSTPQGSYPVSANTIASLPGAGSAASLQIESFLSQYGVWLLLGAAALLIVKR